MIDLIFATDVNWGSSTQAHVYREALTSTVKLVQTEDHYEELQVIGIDLIAEF